MKKFIVGQTDRDKTFFSIPTKNEGSQRIWPEFKGSDALLSCPQTEKSGRLIEAALPFDPTGNSSSPLW